jgi:hypothetical protein
MPIDQTLRGLALEIDASIDPSPEILPLLEYRFIDLASTQTILARILGIPQSDGGGQLAFETNSGSNTRTGRMLIDRQGNVGIGSENPKARLDVAGDARFSGPLSVEGAFTATGNATIRGDLSVTGSLSVSGENLGPTTLDGSRAVQITSDGTIKSPMWTVTQVYLNEQATATPFPVPGQTICPPKPFTTGGGTLLILASGSGAALSGVPGPTIIIGMDLFLDSTHVGSVLSCVNNMTEAKPFLTSGLVVRGIAAGSHTLTLKTARSTVVGVNDFFNVTILELPFQ